MNIIERIKGILLKPQEEWQTIAGETTPIADLYKNYIIILAAIGPVASFIGLSLVGVSLPGFVSYKVPLVTGLLNAVVQYVLTLVGVYVLAFIMMLLPLPLTERKILTRPLSWPRILIHLLGWSAFSCSSLPLVSWLFLVYIVYICFI